MANEVLGKNFRIYYSGKTIAAAQSYTFEMNKEVVDISSLDTAGWKDILVTQKEWSISASAIVTSGTAPTGTTNFTTLLTELANNDSVVTVAIKTATGSEFLSGQGYITKISTKGDNKDKLTYDISISGKGALTITALA